MDINLRKSKLVLLLCLYFVGGCQKNKLEKRPYNHKVFSTNFPCKCKPDNLPNLIKGKCFAEDFTFDYEQGINVNTGPASIYEEFSLSFKGYYHNTFFENIYFDKKLYKMYRDSVKILHIERNLNQLNTIIDCKPCNAVAKLKFRKTDYYFPFTVDTSLVNILDDYHFYHIEDEFSEAKYYISKTGNLASGMLVRPKTKSKDKLDLLSIIFNPPYPKELDLLEKMKGIKLRDLEK